MFSKKTHHFLIFSLLSLLLSLWNGTITALGQPTAPREESREMEG